MDYISTPSAKKRKVADDGDVSDNGKPAGTGGDSQDEIKNHGVWTHGDFEVISSDNVRFRIPSYHLFSHSPVFRPGDLLANAEKRLAFTDEGIETAAVIGLFLDLVLHGDIAGRYDKHHDLLCLANFLTKYDCQAARAGLILHLRRQISEKINVVYQFAVAAHLDDYTTCKLALERWEYWGSISESGYGPTGKHWDDDLKRFCDTLDPAYMPVGLFGKIRTAYGWALIRAWARDYNLNDEASYKWRRALPDRFERFISEARGQKHS